MTSTGPASHLECSLWPVVYGRAVRCPFWEHVPSRWSDECALDLESDSLFCFFSSGTSCPHKDRCQILFAGWGKPPHCSQGTHVALEAASKDL